MPKFLEPRFLILLRDAAVPPPSGNPETITLESR